MPRKANSAIRQPGQRQASSTTGTMKAGQGKAGKPK